MLGFSLGLVDEFLLCLKSNASNILRKKKPLALVSAVAVTVAANISA